MQVDEAPAAQTPKRRALPRVPWRDVARRVRERWEPATFALLAVLAIAAVFLNSWGKVTPDTEPQLYYAPGRTLVQALFSWSPSPFLGQANFNAGIAPVAAFILVLRSLHLPVWITIRVWRALLLLVAGWGAARFFDEAAGPPRRPVARIAMALVYVANPYVVVSGATLPVLLPYSLLPWMMLALARSVRDPASWRRPAAFALAFFLMGAMNAGIVPLFLLLGVPCYVVYARFGQRVPLRTAAVAAGKCLGLALLVSLYWLIPAALARGTGSTIAATTERPLDVSSTSSYAESLRLLGLWPLYGRQGTRLFLPNAIAYITNPFVVIATFLIPIAAAAGALLSRARLRVLAVVLLAVATPVMVGLFPPQSPSPFGGLLNDFFTAAPGGIGFRTTNKIGPLVALALALLIALGVWEAAVWLGRRKLRLRVLAAVGAVAVVAVTVYPAWSGTLYPSGWRDIPDYWEKAAHDLNVGTSDTRVLLLPGEEFANYRWGKRGPTDLTDSLLSRPSVLRTTVPSGSSYAANFLAALDQPLNDGSYRRGGLPTMARYLGVREVLVRNDMTWEEWGAARPSVLAAEINEPGLRLVSTYGERGEYTTSPGRPGPPFSPRSLDSRLPPLQRYVVVGSRPIVRAEAADGSVTIDGDNFALAPLPSLGLLPGGPAFRLMGSMTAAQLSEALRDGTRIVLTDTNRRRGRSFRRTSVDSSATLGADETFRPDGDLTFGLFGDDPDTQSVAVLTGARSITATSYGSVFAPSPSAQPYFAFDGDPRTAWLGGGLGAAVGQSITIRLDRPTTISEVTLRPTLGPGRQVSRVTLNIGGHAFSEAVPAKAATTVTVPPTRTTTLSVQITGVRGAGFNPVGFREIEIPDVTVTRPVRLPLTFDRLAARLSPADRLLLQRTPEDVVLVRQAGSPATAFDDEEPTLDRLVTLPQGRSFTFTGTASISARLSDSAIDHLVGVPEDVVAESSSRAGDAVGLRASQALDGNPNTAWVPASRAAGEYLDVSFPDRTMDHVTIRQDVPEGVTAGSFISKADVSLNGGPPIHTELSPSGTTVTFPSRRVHEVRVTIAEVSGLGGPVRVSELEIPGLRLPATDQTTPLEGCVAAFEVDGVPQRIQLPVTLGRLSTTSPFTLLPCHDERIELSEGQHRIQATEGWQVDLLRLSTDRDLSEPPKAAASAPPAVTVLDRSPTRMTIHADASSSPYFLVLGQGFDPRWRGTIDGRPLGPPIVVDGYSVGWRIPAGGAHTFSVVFGPQRPLTLALALSLAALAVLVAVVRRGRER